MAVNTIVSGADAAISETPKGMTAHGGVHKKGMNIRENRLGEFLRKLAQRCERNNIPLIGVTAHFTSQTCHMCGHMDPESRVTRDTSSNCTRKFHADVNAAYNILYRAAGMVVLRWSGHDEGNKPTPS